MREEIGVSDEISPAAYPRRLAISARYSRESGNPEG